MKFDIDTILSAAYGKLLTDIGNFYKILNYMLDEDLFTHLLPRAAKFASKFILAQHPQLEDWKLENEQINTENWKEYLDLAKIKFGEYLEIQKIPNALWTHKDPIDEAIEIIG